MGKMPGLMPSASSGHTGLHVLSGNGGAGALVSFWRPDFLSITWFESSKKFLRRKLLSFAF